MLPQCLKNFNVRKCLTFITGMVECLFFAGIVLGWASLGFLFKAQGFFGSFCVNTTNTDGLQVQDCRGQDEQFSLVFTIASFLMNFLTLLNGLIFDRFGTLIARLFGLALHTGGLLMLAFATPTLSMLVYPGLSCIAVGGFMLLLTNMQVANLFGAHRSTIITVYNGAFDSSSGVFLLVKFAYESGISLKASFLFLAAGSIHHLLRTIFLFPRTTIPYPLPDNYKYGISCRRSRKTNGTVETDSKMTMDDNPPDQEELKKTEKTFRECILSKFFFLVLLWLSVIQLRHFVFIGTLNPALERLADGDASIVSKYINAFAFTQMCGLLVAPIHGTILDRHKRKPPVPGMSEEEADLNSAIISFFLTSVLALLFSICSSIPVLPLQYFTFVMQMIDFSFLYGGMTVFVAVVFPPCHFGKLYGLITTLSAVFSLLQYACFAVVEELLDGDPLYVNIALTVLILFSFSHPLNVFLHCRKLASQRAKANTSTATKTVTVTEVESMVSLT
ncbi:equilibrative nucleobase transporter 1-like isoform X1 [Corythoichthys intestinalis]|uniref:equilibrative nucleobase transporter 1-like isoform X1 n=1 Tax=Corythoichthys intestinalis TaxID=161448 RepID=UPI0025A59187|nr:equilibrative nucleobase transporter 1-like isoform X1 [Corythoichthys intestinalis]XP_057706479.1 equilibrative nucleobase transporter 1-like isoform X1 [Corythoichthys intestinalis]